MSVIQRLWWWGLDYASALWGQLLGSGMRVVPAAYARGDEGLPTVVLLPGVYEPWGFLEPVARHLNSEGYRVLPVPELGRNRKSVDDSAAIVAMTLLSKGVTRCVIVAHSKGGLIGKSLLLTTPAGVEIIGMVAVATPFAGSSYATLLPGRTMRALAPHDPTILALGLAGQANSRIVSILPSFDPHIPGERFLVGGEVLTLRDAGHFRVLRRREAHEAISAAVARLSASAVR